MKAETVMVERRQSAAPSEGLRCEGIGVAYRRGRENISAVEGVALRAGTAEFVSVIGPSGCGKSTLLHVLAGLTVPDTGAVRLDGQEVTGEVGLVGLMPQRDLLMPWKSIVDNVALPLTLRGESRRSARDMAREWFPRFGLDGFENVYPRALSGGMRQRAALLRTFLTGHSVLLLDEPFGALDALTRTDMQEWLLSVWASSGKTIVLVTHDVDEAIYLSDRVYVMSKRPGRIQREIRIDLPRPRAYDDVVTSAGFARHKRDLLDYLRGGNDR